MLMKIAVDGLEVRMDMSKGKHKALNSAQVLDIDVHAPLVARSGESLKPSKSVGIQTCRISYPQSYYRHPLTYSYAEAPRL